ncbi:malonic semialdehyde reductase [Nocardioides daphniae]|uniref:Malonic semialdehyde reductase n=1 Tax=Nocardioides daphniae TaxID=402297 RepID=A0A4V1CWK6_9ACTN|nr:malonic semialdehyde reductase [Nocardioides daphniae]QCC77597.1 malonic semialdehyde reductase [Nocardioides daphniae]GGD30363.1 nitroreductase family protein [Nocardioides daphniae]
MTDLLALPSDVQDLLFREARTANAFTDEPVSDEQVAAIYDLVKFAPTAMNSQPMRIVLVRSDDARQKLLKHMSGSNRDKTESAPLVAILAADTNFHETLPRTFPHFPGAKDFFLDDTAREHAARFNAGLQIGYFIIGVRAAGLAAGPMTGYDATGVDTDLLEGTGLKSIAVVNIGRPAENAWFDRLPRLAHDEAVITL